MPEVNAHDPGVPSWIDLASPDLDASAAFYRALFGWEVWDTGPDGGGYRMLGLRDRYVAGLAPKQDERQPTAWSCYVTVADADATAAKVSAAGGSVIVAPFDVMTAGRMAVFADPEGAAFSVWQPMEHPGAQLVNEPGAFTWSELNSRDIDGAKRFYGEVFGWVGDTNPMPGPGGEVAYTSWMLGERAVAGALPMPEQVPEDMPPFWLVYIGVADADAAVATAKGLGARAVMEPVDIPIGRFAVLIDPQGAPFGVIALA